MTPSADVIAALTSSIKVSKVAIWLRGGKPAATAKHKLQLALRQQHTWYYELVTVWH